jgi:hypothetical protein
MTQISTKTAFRQSGVLFRDGSEQRAILVALEPTCIVLRLKGTRREFRLPLAASLLRAMQADAEMNRANRKRSIRRGALC